jgi:RNA polymerase sigma-70 factor (ECF subfamily)
MTNEDMGTQMSALPDALLLQRLNEGDSTSFEELFRRHYDRVYGILYRMLGTRQQAEDLAQEVFLRLYRRPPRHGDNLPGWLYRVAMNQGYNTLRAERRRTAREDAAQPHEAAQPGVEDALVRRNDVAQVRATLAALPRRSAQLLIMQQMGFSYREMAAAVGVAPGSVGTLLSRARGAFREAYAAQDEE